MVIVYHTFVVELEDWGGGADFGDAWVTLQIQLYQFDIAIHDVSLTRDPMLVVVLPYGVVTFVFVA